MTLLRRLLVLIALVSSSARAQSPSWGRDAAGLGTTARVLLVGAHPDDEDNALIAWLSLGRHVETAYLSVTRGENGANVAGREREGLLGMVRTAELLAERQRDGAHQFFTRAYDFGRARNDSVLWSLWPRDSLLRDMITVIRAFRPHVVISLYRGDRTDGDPAHRAAGQLAREAVELAADTGRYPAALSSLVGAWSVGAFYDVADSATGTLRIDVGELDIARQRTYAELGAEIRKLQRTQPAAAAPPVGPQYRYLRRESLDGMTARAASPSVHASLFDAVDTTWRRFATLTLPDSVAALVDSLARITRDVHDRSTVHVAHVLRLAAQGVSALHCGEPASYTCAGGLGDLAVSIGTTRDRASRALLAASGIVIDANADRSAIAVGDSTAVTTTVYNGGADTMSVTAMRASAGRWSTPARMDSVAIVPGGTHRWTDFVKAVGVTYPWWIAPGVVWGSAIYNVPLDPRFPVNAPLLVGDDRVLSSSVSLTLHVAGAEVHTRTGPIVAREVDMMRGDLRRPIAGVPAVGVLLERTREYARAGVPFERLARVWVGSAMSHTDSIRVRMYVPAGIVGDSAIRTLVLPPFGSRTLFFRVHGRWKPGEFPIQVAAVTNDWSASASARTDAVHRGAVRLGMPKVYERGFVTFEYPHIPTQRYPRPSTDSIQAVHVQVPPSLRVAYVRANRDEDLDALLTELTVTAFAVDPSMLGVGDLSYYNAILIGPRAFASVEALRANLPALRRFAARGGTVVVLHGGDELLAPGVLPYPIAFDDAKPSTALEPDRVVTIVNRTSSLVRWPNRITSADFAGRVALRARELPIRADRRYQRVITLEDDSDRVVDTGILAARIGTGMFIYTPLAFDRQLSAANPGAARLLVNLLSASLAP